MTTQEVQQQVVEIIKKHLEQQKGIRFFLFGSRVSGKYNERSDYDFGIEAKEKISVKIKFAIQDELDALPILQKIDFVDFSQTSQSFKNEAMKYSKILYEN